MYPQTIPDPPACFTINNKFRIAFAVLGFLHAPYIPSCPNTLNLDSSQKNFLFPQIYIIAFVEFCKLEAYGHEKHWILKHSDDYMMMLTFFYAFCNIGSVAFFGSFVTIPIMVHFSRSVRLFGSPDRCLLSMVFMLL